MNKNSVTSRLRNKSKETGVNYQTLQAFFFYESFLNLLAESPYNENFILKGGLLVSALTGIINRGTVDIDFLMRNQQMNEDTISKIITAVTASADTDSVYFELNKIEPIRENDEYGGLRAHLCGRLANIRQPFYIDIATGDPVTPEAETLDYHPIFGETIRIKSYPIETILAEKLQTILVRADANGRSKDFYDIYILSKLKKSEIRTDQFHTAVQRTFEYRRSSLPNENDALHIIDRIQNDDSCNRRWSLYAKKNPYAKIVLFEDTLNACRQLLKLLYSYNGKITMTKENMTKLIECIPETDRPYEIPANWCWVRLGQLTSIIGGGTPSTMHKEYYYKGTIPWITPADLSDYTGIYIKSGTKFITELGLAKSSTQLLPSDSVLLTSRAPIGYVVIAVDSICTNQGFKNFLPSPNYCPRYLYWYLKGNKELLESYASGTTFLELSKTRVSQVCFPLPPIPEQQRIVDRIESLFSKIDQAKELVQTALDSFENRKAAILHKAFTGELTEKWRAENGYNMDEWEISKLDNSCNSFQYGTSRK